MKVGELKGRIVCFFVINQECDPKYQDGEWSYDGEGIVKTIAEIW